MARPKAFSEADLNANTLAQQVGSSVKNRANLAEDLAPHLPEVITGLVEMARGIWFEKEVPTGKDGTGPTKRIVYQRAPNPKAAQIFLKYAGYDIADLGNSLLAISKVAEVQAILKAKLPDAKAKNLASQTNLNTANSEVFTAALVTEEDVKKAALEVFTAVLAFIQSYPVEVMHDDITKDTASYQNWQMRLAMDAKNAYARAVGIEEEEIDVPMIGHKVEVVDDEYEDEETEEIAEDEE